MKKVLFTLPVAAFMVACSSNPKVDTATQVASAVDTAGLAEFQAFKQQQAALAAQENVNALYAQGFAAGAATAKKTTSTSAVRRTSTASRPVNTAPVYATSESSNAAKAPVKKGISKAAKGAAIGAVGGAAAGAIINKKNRVVGGVIGGILGGGIGYGVGRGMDKKDGRY